MRKLLAVLLVVSMFATTLPAVAGSFPDLKTGHWANVHVESLAEMGVILGYPDGEFKGDRPATRYELAAVVHRAWQKMIDVLDEKYIELDGEVSVEDVLQKLLAEKLAAGELISRAEAEEIAEAKVKEALDGFLKLTEELSPELGELGVDAAKLLALCQKLDTRVTDLESKLAALEDDFRSFQKKISEKCDMMEELKKQVDLLSITASGSDEAAEYLKRLSSQAEDVAKLQETVSDHESRIGQLEATVANHDERLTAIENKLNKYRINLAARLISDGVNTYDQENFWIYPDAPNNWLSLGQKDLFFSGPSLALGFDLNVNVQPESKANLAGNLAGFVGSSESRLPRSLRFNGLAQLDKYQVGVSYLSLGSDIGVYANRILLGDRYTGQLGDPALRNYRELGLLISGAPVTFISRVQRYYPEAAIHTQELVGGTTLPYAVDLEASYKLQTTKEGAAHEHTHRIIRATANRLFVVEGYPLGVTLGAAQRFGRDDAYPYQNKLSLDAVLGGIRPADKLDLNLFFQALAGGSEWEGDFDELSFPSASQALADSLARLWHPDEQHLAVGATARYQIISDMLATGGVKYDHNPKTGTREATVGFGMKYTFDLANFALPNYYVTTGFTFEKIKDLTDDVVVGNRTERSVLVERPISQTSGFFGSWRLVEGSSNLELDDSKDRYFTLGWGTQIAGAKLRVFYDNFGSNKDTAGNELDELKTMDRLCVDLFYAF